MSGIAGGDGGSRSLVFAEGRKTLNARAECQVASTQKLAWITSPPFAASFACFSSDLPNAFQKKVLGLLSSV